MDNKVNPTITTTTTTTNPNPVAKPVYAGAGGAQQGRPFHGASGNGPRRGFSGPNKFGGRPGGRGGAPFVKPEIDYKILNIRRVARITKGGKRFTFSVALVVGDKKGQVGVGIGKAGDTASAIEKAIKSGKKNIVKIKTTKTMSIPHGSEAKYSSSRIEIRPAKGKGLVAGSSARTVFSLAGITDISAKFHSRTKNPLNNAQAAVLALKNI